jgi:hypothetical protein
MNDLDQVERLAEKRSSERDAARRREEENSNRLRALQSKKLNTLFERLSRLKEELSQKLYVDLRLIQSSPADPPEEIRISISKYPMWMLRPHATYRIVSSDYPEHGFKIAPFVTPTVLAELLGKEKTIGDYARESRSFEDELAEAIEGVVSVIHETTAHLLSDGMDRCRPPNWYWKAGGIFGWPLAAATWIALALTGIWGIALGWIPAWLVLLMARWAWLPALFVIVWIAVTQT